MNVLEVDGLTKQYPGFRLSDVSFRIKEGMIMGFIGKMVQERRQP